VLGTTTKREVQILVGDGHVIRTYPFADALPFPQPAGALVALAADNKLCPYEMTPPTSLGAGDGTEKTFAGNVGKFVRAGSASVTDGNEEFTDDGFGELTGSAGGSGKINYLTGTVTVTFNAAPPAEADISADCGYWARGVLARDVDAGAVDAEVVTSGGVNSSELTMTTGDPATAEALAELEFIGPWPA
jgi:hypothetical protein